MFNMKVVAILSLIVCLTDQTRAQPDEPETKDWRDTGCISKPIDQGVCESCSVMAVTSLLETKLCLNDPEKRLRELSQQQIIDCMKPDKRPSHFANTEHYNCKNGNPTEVLNYLKKAGKIALREHYPYSLDTRERGMVGDCAVDEIEEDNFISVNYGYTQFEFKRIGRNDCERHMMDHLKNSGPVASYVTGAKEVMKKYKGGILKDEDCDASKKSEKHGVLVIGYGSENGVDYWIVKNSFGEGWGEEGYFRLRRGIEGGACSICHLAWILV